MAWSIGDETTIEGPTQDSHGPTGPFVDTNGNLYGVFLDTVTGDKLVVYKSSDGGQTWSAQDTAGAPTFTNLENFAGYVSGSILHIVTTSNWVLPVGMTPGSLDVDYHQFHMSDDGSVPDEWDGTIVNEAVTSTSSATTKPPTNCDIAVRSDGDVIVVYGGNTFASMGSDYWDQSYARREGGSWTADISITAQGTGTHNLGCLALGSSDSMHLAWNFGSNSHARTLSSTNSLSTIIANIATATSHLSIEAYQASDSSWKVNLQANGSAIRLEESSGDIALESGQVASTYAIAAATVHRNKSAYDPGADDLYIVHGATSITNLPISYAADGGATSTTGVYTEETLEDLGTNWSGIGTADVNGATYFTHSSGNGGATVIGVIVQVAQGGGNYEFIYDEYSLVAPSVELAGTIAGVATVTGDLEQVIQLLTNAPDGTSSITGDLELVFQLAGASDGVATVTSALDVYDVNEMEATTDGISTVAGTLQQVHQFTGQTDGVASVTATLTNIGIDELAGSTDGVAAITGDLDLVYQLQGTTDGSSTVSGDLELVHQLQAQSDGTSSVTPTLELVYQLQSTPAGTSTVTGTLTNIGFSELASTPAGTSTVTAALTAIGANELEATTAGVATVTGSLTTEALLSAAPDGTSTVTADLEQLALLTTASDGVSTASGALTLVYQLSGVSDGLATFTGTLEQVQQLIGSIAGTSTVTADLPIIYQLTSTPTGASTVSAALRQEVDLRARTVLAPVG